jgi:hypothetical protein
LTLYPAKIGHDRNAAVFKGIHQRLAKLETRTAGIDSGMPLGLLPGVIDPAYTSGDPKVLVNGAAELSGPYQHLASYTPVANDSVILAPVGGTAKAYVVLGKLA